MGLVGGLLYNKGYSNLKNASYRNLVLDLADNPESIKHLNNYKKQTKRQTMFLVGGLAVGAGTIIALTNKGNKDSSIVPYLLGGATSVGAIFFSYKILINKPKHLEKAIKAYNE